MQSVKAKIENDNYTKEHQNQMLSIAAQSIKNDLNTGIERHVKLDSYPQELQSHRATFVTLEIDKQLRGCIGMFKAVRPLILDISENAYASAFHDLRFNALLPQEFNQLEIHISILSSTESIVFNSEQDLLSKLKPGIDGLILSESHHRGTFLPSVWEALPTAEDFLQNLKRKARLPINYWSDNIKIERYSTFSFGNSTINIQKPIN